MSATTTVPCTPAAFATAGYAGGAPESFMVEAIAESTTAGWLGGVAWLDTGFSAGGGMGAERTLRFACGAVSTGLCGAVSAGFWGAVSAEIRGAVAGGAEAVELLAKTETEGPLAERADAAVFSALSEGCSTGDRVR